MRRLLFLMALALTTLLPAGVSTVSAQQRSRCFQETGFCVAGPILDYWERNGGLAVFGYPIGPLVPNEIIEGRWVGPVQWFERDRLEDHGAEGVMAGRMGARYLELRWIDWRTLPQVDVPPPGCAYFPVTRHSLCEPFLSYWRNNGGLERFGYPIGEPQQETIESWTGTVQYFERRRMEHHTELAGTRYEVLLGRLAASARAMQPPPTCDTPVPEALRGFVEGLSFRQWLGCPTELYSGVPAAFQPAQNGLMVWVDLGAAGKHVFVMYRSSVRPGNPLVQYRFDDTWQEGVDPVDYFPGTGQPGLYPLRRGFGKVAFQQFRRGPESIGMGVAPEQADTATVQRFGSGATVIRLVSGRALAFGSDPLQFGVQP